MNDSGPSDSPATPMTRGRALTFAVLLLIAMAGLAAKGISTRLDARAALRETVEAQAISTVSVQKPLQGPHSDEIILPGDVQAYTDAPIYARASGYVSRWLVDIGASVKAAQLMAEIETPEVDQQLRQAQADLNTAIANSRLAASTAKRWKELQLTDSVSRQATDEKTSDASAKGALVESARANVARLKQLQSY